MMIEKIKKYDLCIGCGLCASALGKDKCQMELNSKGFYEPKILTPLSKQENKCIGRLCPGINVKTKANSGVWGAMVSICQAWAADKVVRHKAASGGVVTSLCLYLLEHHKVDAVLQVGVKDNSYLHNELHISRTREDVLKNAQSRYAPSLTFYNIKEILDNSNETFALVGKPCDMAAMKNFISEFPQYKERIKYFISIFCAGMPIKVIPDSLISFTTTAPAPIIIFSHILMLFFTVAPIPTCEFGPIFTFPANAALGET